MTLAIELPDDTLAALRADAEAHGKSVEQVAAERLTALYATPDREGQETANEFAAFETANEFAAV